MNRLVSKIFSIHDVYSTIVGSTQPIFDGIAHSIQKISNSIWNSRGMEMASKKITGVISQSTLVQSGLQKTVDILSKSKNRFTFKIKVDLLNQDPRIKRLKDTIHDLENKIQATYCKVFKKPIFMDKMEFSIEDYQVITSHFQKFLNENNTGTYSNSFPAINIESIIDFIENDTIPDSQSLKEEIITSIENLSPVFIESSNSSENELIIEAIQAFQNCYFLFLSKELLRKFEKGEIYKDDLLIILGNYKTSPITSVINDATIENIAEVCAGTIGEVITESSFAASLHKQIDKRVLGPILSISPFHSLLGRFSSYLGVTLASYIGIKALGSQESLKDYVHNMTWATIASMITEYGLEMSEISDPACAFLFPLIASSVAYNFASLYKPLLKTEYLAHTLSQNYPFIVEGAENLVHIEPIRQKIDNQADLEIKKILEKNITNLITDYFLDVNSYQHEIFNAIPSSDEYENFPMNYIITNFTKNVCSEDCVLAFKNLLLQSLTLKQTKTISNTIIKKALAVFFAEFSKFYFELLNNETLLKDFYAKRLEILRASSNLSDNSDLNKMPDTKDIILKLVVTINPLYKNSLVLSLLFTKVDELLPISLFQDLSKTLEKSLESTIHPFANVDPLFLEVIIKSFIITTVLEKKHLLTQAIDIVNTDVLIFQNTLKLIDSLIHLNLVGQHDKKKQPLLGNIIYKLIHQEMNTAIQSVPKIIEQSA
ncbi:MAG: hypothetical protein ACRCSV_04685 [Chlamydiales bacterium]